MTRAEELAREFLALTAGKCDLTAHGKLALAVANNNYTALWPRVRAIADGIISVEGAGFNEAQKQRLGDLLNEIHAEWERRK